MRKFKRGSIALHGKAKVVVTGIDWVRTEWKRLCSSNWAIYYRVRYPQAKRAHTSVRADGLKVDRGGFTVIW